MDIKTHMETESVSTSYADVVLENRNITQKRKHVDSGQPDEDTQTPNLDDSGHDVSPPWRKGQQHLKAPDDRTEDDYRREDKRKSLKDEPWDEDDDWGESWTDDDWKREHWKSFEDAGVAKTKSDEDARYDAAVEFTRKYEQKLGAQAKQGSRSTKSWSWGASEWGSAYTGDRRPPPKHWTSSASSSSGWRDHRDVKQEPSDE